MTSHHPRHRPARAWGATTLLLAFLLVAPTASAATITSGGPLKNIWVSTSLACQVEHVRDTTTYEFYPPAATVGDCGTLLVVGATLYAPAFSGGTATGGLGATTAFGAVSQTAVTGTGTAATPFQVVTVVNVGATGLQITETDQYVVGTDFYSTDVKVTSTNSVATAARLYRAGDCYLGASDLGYGAVGISPGSVACSKTANNSPSGRFEEFIPVTGGSKYYETDYNSVWTWIGGHTAFPNTCACATYQDNGAGLSWDITVPAQGSVTVSSRLRFSIPPNPASCLADAILVTERDAASGTTRVPFAESLASANPVPGTYTAPPALASSTAAGASRPVGAAHAQAEEAGVHYGNTLLGVRVDASTVHSRCDVDSVNDAAAAPAGVYEDAYGIGGVEDLSLTVGGNSLTFKTLDLEELALAGPASTSATWACDLVDLGLNPPNPVTAVCALPAVASFACTPPLNAACSTVRVAANEVSPPVLDPATGQWRYTASLLHITVNPLLLNAAVVDIYVGHVELAVTGGPAAFPAYVPHVGCAVPPQGCT